MSGPPGRDGAMGKALRPRSRATTHSGEDAASPHVAIAAEVEPDESHRGGDPISPHLVHKVRVGLTPVGRSHHAGTRTTRARG